MPDNIATYYAVQLAEGWSSTEHSATEHGTVMMLHFPGRHVQVTYGTRRVLQQLLIAYIAAKG